MPQTVRRLALAGMVVVSGLSFSLFAPLIAGLLLIPTSPSMSDFPAGMADHFRQLQLAGTVMNVLWIGGMVLAAGGRLYGLSILAFSPSDRTRADSPSRAISSQRLV